MPFFRGSTACRPWGRWSVELGSREPVFDIMVSARRNLQLAAFPRMKRRGASPAGFLCTQKCHCSPGSTGDDGFEGASKSAPSAANGTLTAQTDGSPDAGARFHEIERRGENLSTRALAKNLSGALRQLNRRARFTLLACLPYEGRWHLGDGEGVLHEKEAEMIKVNYTGGRPLWPQPMRHWGGRPCGYAPAGPGISCVPVSSAP